MNKLMQHTLGNKLNNNNDNDDDGNDATTTTKTTATTTTTTTINIHTQTFLIVLHYPSNLQKYEARF